MNPRRFDALHGRFWIALVAVAAFLILFGARLSFVNHYGVDVPYWDQWIGEADFLYRPWMAGTLDLSMLVAPHNEHRIFTTRLLHLSLFAANGEWDTRLEMAANAALHATALVAFVFAVSRGRSASTLAACLLGALAVIGLPFGWENALGGFQSQFYFSLLFQTGALYLLLTRAPLTRGWFAALPLLVLGFLSFASGFVAAPVAAGVAVLESIAERAMPPRRLAAVAGLLASSAACLALTPNPPYHANLHAQSASEFLLSLGRSLAWPWPQRPWLAPLIHAPWLVTVVWFLRGSEDDREDLIVPLGFGAWVAVQAMALAYGRSAGGAEPLSRYLDLLMPGLLVEGACLARILDHATPHRRRIFQVATLCWIGLVVIGARTRLHETYQVARTHKRELLSQADTVRAFLLSGDERVIHGASQSALPVPVEHGNLLLITLTDPSFVPKLPGWLRVPKGQSPAESASGSAPRISRFSEWLLQHAVVPSAMGATLAVAAALAHARVWMRNR